MVKAATTTDGAIQVKVMKMDILKQYASEVQRCAGEGDAKCWALGVAGEAGEVADLIKKLYYHGGSDKKGPITRERILDESGDVIWYLTALLDSFDFTLEECMKANIAKLRKRHPNGFSFATAQAHLDEVPQ